MRITVLCHYPLTAGLSMQAFAGLLQQALEGCGHRVQLRSAPVLLGRLARGGALRKWLGYVDCFVLFPLLFRWQQWVNGRADLYVLSDQALGLWLPLLGCHPHVVHCHDFLALQAALGGASGPLASQTAWSGRLYQRLIRWGFRHGQCFVSVSAATQRQLHAQLGHQALLSEVLPNPLPERFGLWSSERCDRVLQQALVSGVPARFLLHVGRGWYKNRLGVLQIWEQLRLQEPAAGAFALILVGALEPDLQQWLLMHPQLQADLHVLQDASDDLVIALYNRAEALLFPSDAEGFGWPVLEALACGCAVLTTAVPPLTDVGGPWVTAIPPAPAVAAARAGWAAAAARTLALQLAQDPSTRQQQRQGGLHWASQFNAGDWADQLRALYQRAWQLQLQESRP